MCHSLRTRRSRSNGDACYAGHWLRILAATADIIFKVLMKLLHQLTGGSSIKEWVHDATPVTEHRTRLLKPRLLYDTTDYVQ